MHLLGFSFFVDTEREREREKCDHSEKKLKRKGIFKLPKRE
jgi:hypothetical protein